MHKIDEMKTEEKPDFEEPLENGEQENIATEIKDEPSGREIPDEEIAGGEKEKSERIVIPARSKDGKPDFHGSVVRPHKKEDPLFNLRNLLFVSAALAIFGVFLFVINFFNPQKPGDKNITYTFETPNKIFTPVFSGGTPGKVTFPVNIKGAEGKRCLQFSYNNDADTYIGLGTIKPDLKNFKDIKIRICSHTDRTFAVSVTELTGPVYMYVFDLKADQWQEITATPDKFILSGHLQDPDGKLNLDNLYSRLVIADMSGDRGVVGDNMFWLESVVIEK